MADEQNTPNNPSDTSRQRGDGNAQGEDKRTWTGALRDWYRNLMDKMNGGSLVSPAGIVITSLLLILLTSALLWRITELWPVCDLPDDSQNSNAAAASTNANQSAASTANANSNANASVTPRANTNTAANINTSAGTNASANTNSAANTNAVASQDAPANPSPGANGNIAAGAANVSAATEAEIDADSIEPDSGPITGKTLVTIKGKNFGSVTKGVVVKFGEAEAQVSQVSDEAIAVRTRAHSEGVVDVTITRGSESDVLPAAYTYTCPAPRGSTLFWMIIMAGALGGCIHAMRSLYWYAGQRELRWSWLPMYYALPFIGAAMAMLFGLLIVAGFVDNTTGRNESLFMIALAGLVGMFSQQAALKLTDIANAVFTKPGAGTEARPQQSVPVSEPDPTRANTLTATAMSIDKGSTDGGEEVTITGTGFTTTTTVSFGGVSAPIKTGTLTPTSIIVTTPPHPAGEVEVAVKSGDKLAKLTTKFKYLPVGSPDGELELPEGE